MTKDVTFSETKLFGKAESFFLKVAVRIIKTISGEGKKVFYCTWIETFRLYKTVLFLSFKNFYILL